MAKAFHARTMHNKAVQNVAHETISRVGPMPQEPNAAAKWKRRVEGIVRQLHKRHKDDWDKAFELDQALKLTVMAGRELGKRESQASKARRRPAPRSASNGAGADVFESVSEPEITAKPAEGPSGTFTGSRLDSETMPRMPSMPTMPSVLKSDARLKAGSASSPRTQGRSLSMSGLGQRGLSLLQRPWVTLGVGLVVGFVVGNCFKCWLSSRP